MTRFLICWVLLYFYFSPQPRRLMPQNDVVAQVNDAFSWSHSTSKGNFPQLFDWAGKSSSRRKCTSSSEAEECWAGMWFTDFVDRIYIYIVYILKHIYIYNYVFVNCQWTASLQFHRTCNSGTVCCCLQHRNIQVCTGSLWVQELDRLQKNTAGIKSKLNCTAGFTEFLRIVVAGHRVCLPRLVPWDHCGADWKLCAGLL